MQKLLAAFVAAITLFTFASSNANAQVNYGFSVGSGNRIDEGFNQVQYGSRAGACQTQGGNQPSNDLVPIGFIFRFDGEDYEEVDINSNGILAFGVSPKEPVDSRFNSLADASVPIIAPFWDVMRLSGGNNSCGRPGIIQFTTIGREPERIFIADWYDPSLGDGCSDRFYAPVQFQVRLYEGSNKIEFYYEDMNPVSPDCYGRGTATTSASIGLATRNGFLSITPQNGNNAIANSSTEDGAVDLQGTGIDQGTLYTFCPAAVYGDVDQGGTENMQSGDVLLEGINLIVFTSQSFRPFTFISPCASSYSYSITGPNAGDYTISPINGDLDPEKGATPTITFRPTGKGTRTATLLVRDDLGFISRSYTLAGEGDPRTTYVGDVSQGGTVDLNDGDILMTEIKVRNGSSGDFTPITIEILPTKEKGVPDALVTYTLIDPTGQFSIDRTSESVEPGSSSTPVITFAPSGNVDVQTAKLIVDAEGDVREFSLRPFASGPGARFQVDGQPYVSGAALFRNVGGCVGESQFTNVFRVEAIGDEQLVIDGLNVFQVNPEVVQGNPPSPLMRDAFGDPLAVTDYFITEVLGSSTSVEFPIVIQPGQTKTFYLTFIPTRPGKRAARTFFLTNSENFTGVNPERIPVQGMLNMELVGQGIGATMRNVAGKKLPESVLFPKTDVRSSSTATGYVHNTGDCDLRIDHDRFRLVAGDINEFTVMSAFANSVDPATGDYIIPPGGIDSVVVSFTPIRSGSRRASLRLATNDSLVLVGGVTSRGEYYIDLFGVGNVGLEARTVTLPPAVLNGSISSGKAILENTSADLLQIVNIRMISSTGEVIEDPANRWPALPLTVTPGEKVSLGLALVPDAANGAGQRTAQVEVTLSNGNILLIDVTGLVGTRTLNVTPTSLFQTTKVPVGEVARAFTLLTNTGTFPVTIQSYQVTGANKTDYTVGIISRGVIQPGETLPIDVTYTPSVQGVSSAVLEFVTNSTNGAPAGTHLVTLGGEGTSIALNGGNSEVSATTLPTTGSGFSRQDAQESGVSRLYGVVPNPASNGATFRYVLAVDGNITLGLYDVSGRLVQTIVTGPQSAGEHVITADLDNVTSGAYYIRLGLGNQVLTQPVNVVK